MKKLRLIVVAVLCLITTLVVSSFAWLQLKNNGILSRDVTTQRQVEIYFAEDGNIDGFMKPAVLKKGVINDNLTISGSEANEYLQGKKLLPAFNPETYTYAVENGELVTQSNYIDKPATIVYSQFELVMDEAEETTKDLNMKFSVKYFNVDVDDSDINNATPFTQVGALSFNFFVSEQKFTEEQLNTISTHTGAAATNKMIERFVIDNEIPLRSEVGDTLTDFVNTSYATIDTDYRHEANVSLEEKEGVTNLVYSTSFKRLSTNKAYYILLESYYSTPDQLVEGNLPLTGKFVLQLNYGYAQ